MLPTGGGRLLVIITRSVHFVITCDLSSRPPLSLRCRPPVPRGSCWSCLNVWQTCCVRVYLGSDHAGFELKTALISWLGEAGHEAVDCGPASYEPDDDYPPYVMRAAQSVIDNPGTLGIVIGGSGNGEQIAANKVPGVRAALAWTVETAQLARQHNNANVLSLGAREYTIDAAISFAKVFVETPFSEAPRHERRLQMIADYEKTGVLPAKSEG